MGNETFARGSRVLHGVRVCPIWIAPEWVVELAPQTRLDPEEWVDRVAGAGLTGMILSHEAARRSLHLANQAGAPTTGFDFLHRVCDRAAGKGTKVIGYYSVAIDDYQAHEHADWRFKDQHGRGCRDIGFEWVCLN